MSLRRSFLVLSVALASWPARAGADDESLEGLLNESVVTAASSTAETAKDAPATSTVVTADAIRRYGARTLAEAIDMLALGAMSGSNGQTTDMGARGLTVSDSGAEHFLLLINGARANAFINGQASMGRDSGVPLDIVDHIEVILGPGSVLYGSNAMLGVINVVTKDAKDFAGPRVGVETELFTSVRPWAGYGQRFEVAGVQGEVTTEFQYFKQWGPKLYVAPAFGGTDPATGQPYRYTLLGTPSTGTGVWGGAEASTLSTWEAPSAIGRVRLGKFELGFNGSITRSPTNTTANDFDSDSHSVSRRLLLNLAYSNVLTPVVSLRAHAYLNAGDDSSTFYSSWAPDCPDANIDCRFQILLEGVVRGVEVAPSFDWLRNGTFVTLVGADAELRSGRSLVNEFNAATQAPVSPSLGAFDRTDVETAFYAQQTWEPTRWFGLNAGGRLDNDPRFAPVLSPRLAARIDPWSGGTLKVIYSQAFRAQGAETELEYRMGRSLVARGGYTYLDAVVQRSFTSDALGPSFNTSSNFATIPIGVFSPLIGARPFRRAPHSGYVAVTYHHARWTASLTGTFVGKRDDSDFLSDKDGGTSLLLPNRNLDAAYQKVDLGGSYQLNHALGAYADLQNVLSQHYDEAFGYPALPFTFRTGIRITLGGESWKLK